MPQLAKKEIEGFKHSDFTKVGLQGPPTGVRLIEWSYDSQFMATKVESMPNAVWVWDMTTLQLTALLVHLNPVLAFKFAPQQQQLVICTGQSRVFCWTPRGACVIDLPRNELSAIPGSLSVHRLIWNPRATNILLTDKQTAVLAFPQLDYMQKH